MWIFDLMILDFISFCLILLCIIDITGDELINSQIILTSYLLVDIIELILILYHDLVLRLLWCLLILWHHWWSWYLILNRLGYKVNLWSHIIEMAWLIDEILRWFVWIHIMSLNLRVSSLIIINWLRKWGIRRSLGMIILWLR